LKSGVPYATRKAQKLKGCKAFSSLLRFCGCSICGTPERRLKTFFELIA
jgi:hypothetical protein